MKLILASNSKPRKAIIDMAGLKCEVIPSNVDENIDYTTPDEYVKELSLMKASHVAKGLNDGIIISADTIVYIDNEKFEKPKNREDAYRIMKMFSGNVNFVVTGVTIKDLYKNNEITFSETGKVYFKEMSEDEINWYLDHEENVYRVAGYSMETKGSLFVTRVEGDYLT
jgi:septum formation protein